MMASVHEPLAGAGAGEGRSDEAKKAFYAKVVENLARDPGIEPANVLITIAGNTDIDWSFRDGVARFCP